MSGNNPGFAEMARKRKVFVWSMRKNWNIRYDDTWREIMSEVARELKIPYGDVERINTAWWKFVSEMMSRVELPVIRMVYLCSLRPSMKELYGYCSKMGEIIEKLTMGMQVTGHKVGDVGKMVKHIGKLHDSYFRIMKEIEVRKRKGREMTEKEKEALRTFNMSHRRQIAVRMMEARIMKQKLNENDTKG